MRLFNTCALCAVALSFVAASDSDEKKPKQPPLKPCTIRSPTSGSFFDLNSLSVLLPPKDAKDKKKTEDEVVSWHAKGYDYGSNFTLNICAPVVEELGEVEGVDRDLRGNVSAFYTIGDRTFSIG